jgi:hypothetical protein
MIIIYGKHLQIFLKWGGGVEIVGYTEPSGIRKSTISTKIYWQSLCFDPHGNPPHSQSIPWEVW